MPRLLLFSLLLALATACTSTKPTGRADRQGDRQGRHRTYYDDARTQLFVRGRYRHGQPVGRWRYYAQAGYLQHKERYRRHGLSDISYYYPSGRVAKQGHARLADEPDGLHFYWFGDWNYYSPAGALDSVQVYTLGKRTSTRHLSVSPINLTK
ncbi:MAG: toxin-antitoxin system YwqK family antitoxin [Janthinobacterium lividum]